MSYLIYFNYEKDEVLILDQELPEVAIPKLFHNGIQIDIPMINDQVILNDLCICKWMKDEKHWYQPQ